MVSFISIVWIDIKANPQTLAPLSTPVATPHELLRPVKLESEDFNRGSASLCPSLELHSLCWAPFKSMCGNVHNCIKGEGEDHQASIRNGGKTACNIQGDVEADVQVEVALDAKAYKVNADGSSLNTHPAQSKGLRVGAGTNIKVKAEAEAEAEAEDKNEGSVKGPREICLASKDEGESKNANDRDQRDESGEAVGEGRTSMEETSNNGRWSNVEHDRFIQALNKYGKNWKKVQQYVGTRSSTQVRSHAQKYFNKCDRERLKYSPSSPPDLLSPNQEDRFSPLSDGSLSPLHPVLGALPTTPSSTPSVTPQREWKSHKKRSSHSSTQDQAGIGAVVTRKKVESETDLQFLPKSVAERSASGSLDVLDLGQGHLSEDNQMEGGKQSESSNDKPMDIDNEGERQVGVFRRLQLQFQDPQEDFPGGYNEDYREERHEAHHEGRHDDSGDGGNEDGCCDLIRLSRCYSMVMQPAHEEMLLPPTWKEREELSEPNFDNIDLNLTRPLELEEAAIPVPPLTHTAEGPAIIHEPFLEYPHNFSPLAEN